ncbi:MAG: hypothetical protein BWY75_02656 [bacterium ADurb.Bin425]|nr:MAG: hypothetical protein BWY75_02656 [bacterium ADurb.Bin425]
MLPVLVHGGGADALKFTTSQCWFQNVGGVDGAFGGTGTNQGMQFIDNQHDIAGSSDFIHDLFETLFELAAILGTGHQKTDVEHDNLLVHQNFWHIGIGNANG